MMTHKPPRCTYIFVYKIYFHIQLLFQKYQLSQIFFLEITNLKLYCLVILMLEKHQFLKEL